MWKTLQRHVDYAPGKRGGRGTAALFTPDIHDLIQQVEAMHQVRISLVTIRLLMNPKSVQSVHVMNVERRFIWCAAAKRMAEPRFARISLTKLARSGA